MVRTGARPSAPIARVGVTMRPPSARLLERRRLAWRAPPTCAPCQRRPRPSSISRPLIPIKRVTPNQPGASRYPMAPGRKAVGGRARVQGRRSGHCRRGRTSVMPAARRPSVVVHRAPLVSAARKRRNRAPPPTSRSWSSAALRSRSAARRRSRPRRARRRRSPRWPRTRRSSRCRKASRSASCRSAWA